MVKINLKYRRIIFLIFYTVLFFIIATYPSSFVFRIIDLFQVIVLSVFIYKYRNDTFLLNTSISFLNFSLVLLSAVGFAFLLTAIYARGDEFNFVMQQRYEYSVLGLVRIFVLSPILEELIYRKYWGKYLTEVSNRKIGSVLLISFVFALTHFYSETPLIVPFVSSVFLFWIYYRSKNILLCILWHSVFNISSFYSPAFFSIENMQIIKIVSLVTTFGAVLFFTRIPQK